MPLPFSELLNKATEIREEVIPSANSAERVGYLLEELVKALTLPYDSTRAYQAGNYVLFSSSLYRALESVAVGESPALVPAKWKIQINTPTLDGITQASDELQIEQAYDLNVVSGMAVVVDEPDKNGILRKVIRFFGGTNSANFITSAFSADNIASLRPRLGIPTLDQLFQSAVSLANLTFGKGTNIIFRLKDQDENGNPIAVPRTGINGFFERAGDALAPGFFFGLFNRNAVGVENDQGASVVMEGRNLNLNVDLIQSSSPNLHREHWARVLSPTSQVSGLFTMWLDPTDSIYKPRQVSARTVAEFLLPEIKSQLEGIETGQVPRMVDDVYCYQEPENSQAFVLTAAMIGIPQVHRLNAPGDQIFPSFLNANSQPEQVMVLTFPDTDHYQIDYPANSDVSGYDGGKLRLDRLTPTL